MEALRIGIRDENRLTNIAFYLHHPERHGKPLTPEESKLVEQWKAFRTLVRYMAAGRLPAPAASTGGHFEIQMTLQELN